jgi:4-hydroxybenzoate polyprenyltransferase
VPAAVRLVHPAPALAVIALSAALGAILLGQAGRPLGDLQLGFVVLAVAGSQVATGALNDWADRHRDRLVQPTKPIPAGELTPPAALGIAAGGLLLQVAASVPLGATVLGLGLVAVGSAAAYNLWLSRTPLSVVPYVVSFGVLPLWIAAGVDVPLERVAPAAFLAAPFAAAAHLANTLRDFDADAALGSRNLAQVLGRHRGMTLAWALAVGVGLGVGAAFLLAGELSVPAAALGLVGVAAVGQGLASPRRLWFGILVAAVAWTAAWALATA